MTAMKAPMIASPAMMPEASGMLYESTNDGEILRAISLSSEPWWVQRIGNLTQVHIYKQQQAARRSTHNEVRERVAPVVDAPDAEGRGARDERSVLGRRQMVGRCHHHTHRGTHNHANS